MDVPLSVIVRPRSHVDLMDTPGAYASTQVPQFENDAFASVLSDAATVNTPLAPAGEELHASALSVPAATARKTPEFQRFVTALLSAVELDTPSDMWAAAGLWWLYVTQSTPAITSQVKPTPAPLSPRTPGSETTLATPYVAAPTV